MDFDGIWIKTEKMRIATGLDLLEAEELFSVFEHHLQINPNGQGRPDKLNVKQIFLMALVYLRHNLTFEFLSLAFEIDDATVQRWIEKAEKSLEDSLIELGTLPQVITENCKKLKELEIKDTSVLIDGAEQPVRIPKDKDAQKQCYSGKKRHTQKILIFSDPKKTIIAITEVYVGSSHDFGIYKCENISQFIPKDKVVLVDNGFEGVEKNLPENKIKKPKIKTRGKQLNGGEKFNNKRITIERVKVEHAIGGMKRYRIVPDIWRNISRDINRTHKAVYGI